VSRRRQRPLEKLVWRMCGSNGTELRREPLREETAPWLAREPILCSWCLARLAVRKRPPREEDGWEAAP
jgi:hypothetical protein